MSGGHSSSPVQSRPVAVARALGTLPRWPGSHRSLRLAVTLSVAGILLALVIGMLVRGSTAGLSFDLWLNGQHSPGLDAVSSLIAVGFQPTSAVAIGLLLAVVVWLRTRHVVAGLAAGAAVACGWLVTGALKVIVSRTRPEWTDAVHRIVPPETDGSYPSGHVAFATALATVIVLLAWRTAARNWVIVGGALLVLVTALSRMYVVVHYPADVMAGALCAVCGVVLAYAAIELIARVDTRCLSTLRKQVPGSETGRFEAPAVCLDLGRSERAPEKDGNEPPVRHTGRRCHDRVRRTTLTQGSLET